MGWSFGQDHKNPDPMSEQVYFANTAASLFTFTCEGD